MKELRREDIERDYFVSQILVGECPNCGSDNTHDCEAIEFDFPIVPSDEEHSKQLQKYGSECDIAKKLDDPTIGHCDDCGYLWCLECGSELTIENPKCGHWEICDKCDVLREMIDDEGEPISEAYTCPYNGQIDKCLKIKEWKKTSR